MKEAVEKLAFDDFDLNDLSDNNRQIWDPLQDRANRDSQLFGRPTLIEDNTDPVSSAPNDTAR